MPKDAHTKITDWYELVNRDSKSVWTLYIFQLGEGEGELFWWVPRGGRREEVRHYRTWHFQ